MAEQGADLLHSLSANSKNSNQAAVIDGRLRERLQDLANRRNEWSEFSYELTTAQSRLLFKCLAGTKCSVGDLLGLLSQVARTAEDGDETAGYASGSDDDEDQGTATSTAFLVPGALTTSRQDPVCLATRRRSCVISAWLTYWETVELALCQQRAAASASRNDPPTSLTRTGHCTTRSPCLRTRREERVACS